jgi:hypothetical protein
LLSGISGVPHTNPTSKESGTGFLHWNDAWKALGRKYGIDEHTVARILEYNKQSEQSWLDQIRKRLRDAPQRSFCYGYFYKQPNGTLISVGPFHRPLTLPRLRVFALSPRANRQAATISFNCRPLMVTRFDRRGSTQWPTSASPRIFTLWMV